MSLGVGPAHRISIRALSAIGPPRLMQCRQEGADLGPCDRIILDERQKHADPPNVIALLRVYCERPCRSTAEQRDELAPSHLPSIARLRQPWR